MPDHKFRQRLDRNYVLLDAKQRIIDLMENGQDLPEIGIYDEPVRYFKANEEWCKIIFGWLDWLEDVAGWHDAEDDNYSGIQQILIFEEGIELPMTIDYEAMAAAICDGLLCAAPKIGSLLATGVTKDFAIDEDGELIIGGEGGEVEVELPEDDPATTVDESLAASYGGAINIRLMIQSIFNDLAAWHFASATEATAKQRLILLYDLEAGANLDAFVTYYWTVDASPDTVITLLAALDQYLFCKGVSQQTFAKYALKAHTVTTDRETLLMFAPLLSASLLEQWYSDGIDTPSTLYREASCTKIPFEEFDWNFALTNDPNYTLNGTWKINHRMLITHSGSFTDTDVPNVIKDAFYSVDTVTGIKTFEVPVLNVSGTILPTQAQLPYEPSHNYSYTVDKTGSNNSGNFQKANGSFTLPNVVGIIHTTIEDLGEFAV